MATDATCEEFVTIVPVGENRPIVHDPAFVTVLTVGAVAGAAEILVYRPRGARLGLGLKFEGGSAAAEKVRRLLVQSCAEDSPAANASAPWGKLIPGDEILAIDGVSVSDLTRIDCVRRLKDSDENLKLLVKHLKMDSENEQPDTINLVSTSKQPITDNTSRPTALPPPVPPRKLGKKNSFKDKSILQTVGENNSGESGEKDLHGQYIANGQHNFSSTITKLSRKSSFDSHILRQKESIAYLKKGSPEEVRRLVRRLSDGKAIPPDADVYIDLLSTEWERCLSLADAESDDTGSSISTVVDRLGSMASSVENSIPSTPTMQPKTIDIQQVLNCIENIDSNILKDMTGTKFLEKRVDLKHETKAVEKFTTFNGFTNHETTTQMSVISEEVKMPTKKLLQNDKNNNNTIIQNMTSANLEMNKLCKSIDSSDNKMELSIAEKPKPMPRNTKIERSASEKKTRPIPKSETSPPKVVESLLTPTKKNCIETWLQRSEAEMSNKAVEKVEETVVPEVLPRLIDFVPKPQYKECGNESNSQSLTRPTAPPPPPPVETREDGSGASLDTIGELDESSDVTDNAKQIVTEKQTKERKSSYERNFWEDRVNKSDAEDKSLSNDEIPLPTCPRQPPDGVETPSDAVEKTIEISRPPPKLRSGWPTTRSRYSYSSRTQDARSEASVKDKIAMFSNEHTASSDRLDKCGTLPLKSSSTAKKSVADYTNRYPEVSSLDRRLTKSQDNLDETPRSYKGPTDRPEVLGAQGNTMPNTSTIKTNRLLHAENKPLFYGSTTTLPSNNIDSSFQHNVYHARSVSDDNGSKKPHVSNLEYLIEQRKKSMSKLRGLAIPETQISVIDLPEIKVQDTLSKIFPFKSEHNTIINNKDTKINTYSKPASIHETKWKSNILSNNIPKYSPAFKRKSLQVYTTSTLSKESTPERKFNEKVDTISKLTSKPSRYSLDVKNGIDHMPASKLVSKYTVTENAKLCNKDNKSGVRNCQDYKNVEIKICTATEVVDSDNDSAMSSTQSSYRSSASSPLQNLDSVESDSSRVSPKISHYVPYSLAKTDIVPKLLSTEKSEEYHKRNICRSMSSDTNVSLSSSAGSAATSGSQASCSSLESSVPDSDKRKVSKPYNVDTINRRNILASAKCRSGRDAKLESPVVETKFSHESYDRSSSPIPKTSDRLSTLTSSVSATSNKGENRRRNKVMAETDSDSDSEVNVRQRKTDFKITRLKRNLSITNKNKQTDTNAEVSKLEDIPRTMPENSDKTLKKVISDNSCNTLSKSTNNTLNKNDTLIIRKIEENIKSNTIVEQKDAHNNIVSLSTEKQHNLNENGDSSNKVVQDIKIPTKIIRLKRGSSTGVGLILAGGIDCEAKEVTIHRVLSESIAAKAGLKRGAKVRSINGHAMTGLSHSESVAVLKEQRLEVVIEIENETRDNANKECDSENAESKAQCTIDDGIVKTDADDSLVTVLLEKAGGGAGLGFGLDGGRDSPFGDRPLTIKKLFAGGAAAQSGRVLVGAELISAGGQSMEGFTRTQAWAALKALPSGRVTLVLRNPKTPSSS